MNLSMSAIEILIQALEKKIFDLNLQLDVEQAETFSVFVWMKNEHPELVREWVEFIYKEQPEFAKKIVGAFHDETIDLSTIPCTGTDFKPW